jgi:rod shape determining protein RodA
MLSKKAFRDFDFGLLGVTLLLVLFGLVSVYSTTYLSSKELFFRQLIWTFIGLFIGTFFYLVSLRFLNAFAWVFYIVSIIGLILVLFGPRIHGSRRWLDIGIFRIQPSEIAKLGTLLFLARFLSNKKFQITELRHLIIPLIIVAVPFLLVLVEPDAGTSAIFLFLGLLLLFYKGTSIKYLFIIVSPLLALISGVHWIPLIIYLLLIGTLFYFSRLQLNEFIPSFLLNLVVGILHPVIWNKLEPYQRARITSFLFPSHDLRGGGWQILQSKIAIGSGGFWGKGMFKGTQKGFDFLPEVHTDFIFSSIGEELGFMGCCIVLIGFFILIWKGIKLVKTCRSEFYSFLALGVIGIFSFQIFVNIGMSIGIIPVVGVPLVFFSYGGSNMVTSLAMIGILLNIAKHRFEY